MINGKVLYKGYPETIDLRRWAEDDPDYLFELRYQSLNGTGTRFADDAKFEFVVVNAETGIEWRCVGHEVAPCAYLFKVMSQSFGVTKTPYTIVVTEGSRRKVLCKGVVTLES